MKKISIYQQEAEVTGTFIVIRLIAERKITFAIDCGIYQEKENEIKNSEPFPVLPTELSFVAVTHAHMDHIGRIPFLINSGFTGPILTSKVSKEIMEVALNKEYYQIIGNEYNEKKVVIETEETQISITFIKNAHVFGASSILINVQCCNYEEVNLFFSGDYNRHNLLFRQPRIPKDILQVPNLIAVVESTYAEKAKQNKMKKCFEKNVLEWALNNEKGTLVIPAYSLGKTQEVLYLIKKLQDMLPEIFSMPIYLDGKLAQEYSELYYTLQNDKILKVYKGKEDIYPMGLTFVQGTAKQKEYIRNRMYNQEKKIIISSSGNGSMGYAYKYIEQFVEDPNTLIHFTGYCSQTSMGGILKNTAIGAKIQFSDCTRIKRATVKFTSEFSGHCPPEDIIELLKSFSDLKFALVNHGTSSGKEKLVEMIAQELEIPTGKLGEGEEYTLYLLKKNH